MSGDSTESASLRPPPDVPHNTTDVSTIGSPSSAADFVQLPVFILIILFAGTYAILVLSQRTIRAAKFTWLAVNVCMASICFAAMQLIAISNRLRNVTETSISCRSKSFIVNMATCHIMYSHCIASICRLLSIRLPQKSIFKSARWLLSSIATSWIIGILIALPYLFLDGFACTSGNGASFLRIYTSLSTILVPIVIVALCNIFIFRYVRQSSRRIHSIGGTKFSNSGLNRRDVTLCKTMLLTFAVFVCGWGPLFIEQVFFSYQYRYKSTVSTFFQILSPSSLLADVILLIYSDHLVRSMIMNVCRCRRRASR